MEFVNLSPIDIAESSFETEDGVSFDLSKLDRKKTMTEAVAKMLKKSTDLSDSNLVRNVNGLWSKKSFSDEDSIKWIGKTKQKDFQRINLKYHIDLFRAKSVTCGSLRCYFNIFNADCFV